MRREVDAALWLGREFEAEIGEDGHYHLVATATGKEPLRDIVFGKDDFLRKWPLVEATDSVHIREVREAGFWTKGVAAIRLDGFPVLIDWRATPFGGSRAYFLCPECSARVEILYAAPHFACRRCHHLAHRSENQTPLWRKSAT